MVESGIFLISIEKTGERKPKQHTGLWGLDVRATTEYKKAQ